MPNPYKYKSISLKTSTVSKLNILAKELIPGMNLSNAKAVEVMIDTIGSSEDRNTGNSNETVKKAT
jgi:hypothetical protein|tara:strand:+ start:456 stop:653 length:198 start_codon:yes stop_codon:yes gene_type:complete